jgi:small subunit ribosomal protein S4
MARKLGPKHKLCRRSGLKLCDSAKCPVVRRPYPPGQHGPRGGSRLSEYGIQLAEKQKAKLIYGILERQFAKYFSQAMRKKGDTGEHLLELLERRLDNVVFRLIFAVTHAQARQYTTHGMIKVNGRRVTIPSYIVKPGDEISLMTNARIQSQVAERMKGKHDGIPTWLELDAEKRIGKITRLPVRDDVQQPLNMQLIVEYYSR